METARKVSMHVLIFMLIILLLCMFLESVMWQKNYRESKDWMELNPTVYLGGNVVDIKYLNLADYNWTYIEDENVVILRERPKLK